jgi:DNA mismatch endonuclease (patch repair protein)
MDKIDSETRSRVMASVHSENTKPEMVVRSAAHKLGLRFRLHRKELPGKPDLVFPSRKVALFVHGCFWHGHDCPHGRRMPATNIDYWREKIRRNKERDAKAQAELNSLGWKSVVIWECQIKADGLSEMLARKLANAG